MTNLRTWAAIGAALAMVAMLPAQGAAEPLTADQSETEAAQPPSVRVCGALDTLMIDGEVSCTHGPDPAPEGIDISTPRPLESSMPEFEAQQAPSPSSVPCYGDGVSGKRVQAIYARPSDRPDRAGEVIPMIRRWAAEADGAMNASAQRLAATRHIRFVTTPECALDVESVVLSPQGDDSLTATIAELRLRGYDRTDRKYLVWMDSTVLCGVANFYIDDRPTRDNMNNGVSSPGTVARVDSGCWGLGSKGQSVEAHEVVHTLGGVQPSAPNATAHGHCSDENDRMCYEDGSPLYRQWTRCDPSHEALLDCGNDDYFSPSPPPGSYLETHWNTARSDFLAAADPPPPPAETLTRLAGATRIETAIKSSQNAFPDRHSASAAVLANDRSFADALPGVPLADRKGGPLLLNNSDRLDSAVAAELSRVLPTGATVYLLGGTGVLAPAVAEQLEAMGYEPVRYGGPNRYATAAIIAEEGLASPQIIFEATGRSFPDALAGGSAAAAVGAAVLLTDGSRQSAETAGYIARNPTARRYALGGPAATADPAATSIAGPDRYATATAVAREFFATPRTVGVASGRSFADALSGGANIAVRKGPMLLADRDVPVPSAVAEYLRDHPDVGHAVVYGGTGVVTDAVARAIAELTA